MNGLDSIQSIDRVSSEIGRILREGQFIKIKMFV
jgi:hypothetical protein